MRVANLLHASVGTQSVLFCQWEKDSEEEAQPSINDGIDTKAELLAWIQGQDTVIGGPIKPPVHIVGHPKCFFARDVPCHWKLDAHTFVVASAPGWESADSIRDALVSHCRSTNMGVRVWDSGASEVPHDTARRYVLEAKHSSKGWERVCTVDACTDFLSRQNYRFGIRARSATESSTNIHDNGWIWMIRVQFHLA